MSMRRTLVYMSGPMTGKPKKNFPAFDAAEAEWVRMGFAVHNPAKEEQNHGKKWQECMRNDIKALVVCDVIAMLPGWEDSFGARLEHAIAVRLQMPVYDAITFQDLNVEPRLVPEEKNVPNIPDTKSATQQQVDEVVDTLQGAKNLKVKLHYGTVRNVGESICQEAHRVVSGPRGDTYDNPLDNFERTATIWSVIFGHPVTPEQVGLCMIGVKVAREAFKHHRDNLVDTAGYAQTVEMVHAEKQRRQAQAK